MNLESIRLKQNLNLKEMQTCNAQKYSSKINPTTFSCKPKELVNIERRKSPIYSWVPLDDIVNANHENSK